MALPVEKRTQTDIINTLLPTQDPGQQFITAARLRDSLTPIVDATNNMKTIWSGTVRVRTKWNKFDYNDNVQADVPFLAIWVQEDYYDNAYFPALDVGNLTNPLSAYTMEGCRYRIINQGSGMADNTYYNVGTNSQINNVPPATVNYNANVYGGFGLTLNCKVQGGVLIAVEVVNPGSGYCWGKFGSSVTDGQSFYPQDIEINIPGAVVKPIIRYDLSRVVNQAFLDGGHTPGTRDGNNYWTNVWSYLNFFVPKADTHNIYGNEIQVINRGGAVFNYGNIWPWRRNDGSDTGWTPATRFPTNKLEFNLGRATRYPTYSGQDADPPVKGFSIAINNQVASYPTFLTNSSKTQDQTFAFTLQVPIKNQTANIPAGYWQ